VYQGKGQRERPFGGPIEFTMAPALAADSYKMGGVTRSTPGRGEAGSATSRSRTAPKILLVSDKPLVSARPR